MKVAVTGGTGFVGKAIVDELLRAGYKVRILSRRIPDKSPEGTVHIPGSVVTGEGLETFVDNVDAVVHLVGIIREAGENTFKAVHHDGTVNILLAASRAGVKRYVHMSALGTRENAVSNYHKTKFAGEEAVRASGLPWTIFRPSTIFGPGDSFINMLAQMMRRSPVIPVMGGGKGLMQPVYVEDVATAFRTALQSETHIGKTYELGGADTLSLMQIMKKVAQQIDKKPFFISIPAPMVAPFLKLAQALGIQLPITTEQLIMLGENNIRTGGDPVEALGIEWTGFEEGIKKYLVSGSSV